MARATTCGRQPGQPVPVDADDVDVLAKVVDPQGAAEASGPGRRQHVVGAGDVVADAGGGPRAEKHRTGAADQRDEGFGIVVEQLEMLGGDDVGDGHGLLRARRRGRRSRPAPGWRGSRPVGARRR